MHVSANKLKQAKTDVSARGFRGQVGDPCDEERSTGINFGDFLLIVPSNPVLTLARLTMVKKEANSVCWMETRLTVKE